MRNMKAALSALAIAVAVSGTAWAAGTTAPTPPVASSSHANTPVKHKVVKKRSAKHKPASSKLAPPAAPKHH
jgi:hypothetical protein